MNTKMHIIIMSSIDNEDILSISDGVSSQILLRFIFYFLHLHYGVGLRMQVANQIRVYPMKMKLELFYYG